MSLRPSAFSSPTGFTLIELVLVLVLLGVVSAVAVPKYYDLQERAQEKACAQSRSVVLSALNGEFLTKALEGDSLADIDQARIDARIAALENSQEKLCPADGVISATANFSNGAYAFDVRCSIHHPGSGGATDGGTTAGGMVSASDSRAFLDWILQVFKQPSEAPEDSPWGTGDKVDLATFFFQNGPDTEVDSDATSSSSYMAAFVDKALKADGLDTSGVIWKLSKEGWKKGANSGTLLITVADRGDAVEANVGTRISATQYRIKVSYENGTPVFGRAEVTEGASVLLSKNQAQNYYKLQP